MAAQMSHPVLGELKLRGEAWWGTVQLDRLRSAVPMVLPLELPWPRAGEPPRPTAWQVRTFEWLRANEARVMGAAEAELARDYNEIQKWYEGLPPPRSFEGLELGSLAEPPAVWRVLEPMELLIADPWFNESGDGPWVRLMFRDPWRDNGVLELYVDEAFEAVADRPDHESGEWV